MDKFFIAVPAIVENGQLKITHLKSVTRQFLNKKHDTRTGAEEYARTLQGHYQTVLILEAICVVSRGTPLPPPITITELNDPLKKPPTEKDFGWKTPSLEEIKYEERFDDISGNRE
jgi:hypothetical protein